MDSTINLVSELLAEMLIECDEQLVISIKPDTFICDWATGIEITEPGVLSIVCAKLNETGLRTEISMSGTVEGQGDERYSCSLYFIMKRPLRVIPGKTKYREGLAGKCLLLPMSQSSKNLHNSLFNLTLKGVNSSGKTYDLSEGRGYVLFNR
ncbi:MAG: hypothetical protein ACI8ZB_002056 [Desulforhopalus sp.]